MTDLAREHETAGVGVGIYSLPEAAAFVQTSTVTIRRWLMGYRFPVRHRGGLSRPVFSPQLPVVEGHIAIGFLDLIELLFIKKFRKHGVTLPTIRRAARKAGQLWSTDHPFCLKKLKTDGRTIFGSVEMEEGDEGLLDLARSQWAFQKVIDPYLSQVDYDLGAAIRWWPLGRKRPVFLDPRFCFGRPIVEPGHVPTRAIYAAIQADQAEREVAKWLDISVPAVRAAVEFERSHAA